MAARELELRIAALEADVKKLKQQLQSSPGEDDPWLKAIYGAFANDPIYDEAMELGRKYRKSLRPRPAGKSSRAKVKLSRRKHQL